MYPNSKLPHEEVHRKVFKMATPAYTTCPKTPETSGTTLTDAAGNPEPIIEASPIESE